MLNPDMLDDLSEWVIALIIAIAVYSILAAYLLIVCMVYAISRVNRLFRHTNRQDLVVRASEKGVS